MSIDDRTYDQSFEGSCPTCGQEYCGELVEKAITLHIETVTADWKDTEGLIESFKEALNSFGISVIEHPNCEGSDQYGFLLSNRPLTEDEIKAQRYDAEEDNDS